MADTIFSYLAAQASERPKAEVMLAPCREALTYERLALHVSEVAMFLRAHGLTCQDRVGILLPNGPELGVAILAVSSCAVCVPVNPDFPPEELKSTLSLLKVKAVILNAGGFQHTLCCELGLMVFAIQSKQELPAGLFAFEKEVTVFEDVDWSSPDDIAVVYHTSGTTSQPKVVPVTHQNLCWPLPKYIHHFRMSPRDRILGTTPLFYAFGMTVMLTTTIASGGSAVFFA